jgi:DNA-binding transcriptional MerR regulator
MTRRFRCDEAAARLGLPESVLGALVTEGLMQPSETIQGQYYFRQDALDRCIQDLHSRIQRASWRDMEERMEEVERRLASMEAKLDQKNRKGF